MSLLLALLRTPQGDAAELAAVADVGPATGARAVLGGVAWWPSATYRSGAAAMLSALSELGAAFGTRDDVQDLTDEELAIIILAIADLI